MFVMIEFPESTAHHKMMFSDLTKHNSIAFDERLLTFDVSL